MLNEVKHLDSSLMPFDRFGAGLRKKGAKYPIGSYASWIKKDIPVGAEMPFKFEDYNPLQREISKHLNTTKVMIIFRMPIFYE